MDTAIGCSVIIYNQENEVLICQRSATKKCFPLMWELVGGGLEDGETPEQCIRREAMEEIGCELGNLKLLDVNILYDDDRYVGVLYSATITDEIRHNDEIVQTRWITQEEIDHYAFMTDGKRRLQHFFTQFS